MTYQLKNTTCLFLSAATLGGLALLAGCGGGSGNGNSTPSVTATPSPFSATYNATYVPSATIPKDGQAPTGALTISGSKGTLQTTYYLQPSVVTAVQTAINNALTGAGYSSAISDNQLPQNIAFTGSGQIDSNGKVTLTAKKSIDICGTATLTVDPTFTTDGTTTSGTGTYQITFPNNLVARVRGREVEIKDDGKGNVLTCNNLPLRSGTVTFTK